MTKKDTLKRLARERLEWENRLGSFYGVGARERARIYVETRTPVGPMWVEEDDTAGIWVSRNAQARFQLDIGPLLANFSVAEASRRGYQVAVSTGSAGPVYTFAKGRVSFDVAKPGHLGMGTLTVSRVSWARVIRVMRDVHAILGLENLVSLHLVIAAPEMVVVGPRAEELAYALVLNRLRRGDSVWREGTSEEGAWRSDGTLVRWYREVHEVKGWVLSWENPKWRGTRPWARLIGGAASSEELSDGTLFGLY